jgi:hypothetical protein
MPCFSSVELIVNEWQKLVFIPKIYRVLHRGMRRAWFYLMLEFWKSFNPYVHLFVQTIYSYPFFFSVKASYNLLQRFNAMKGICRSMFWSIDFLESNARLTRVTFKYIWMNGKTFFNPVNLGLIIWIQNQL